MTNELRSELDAEPTRNASPTSLFAAALDAAAAAVPLPQAPGRRGQTSRAKTANLPISLALERWRAFTWLSKARGTTSLRWRAFTWLSKAGGTTSLCQEVCPRARRAPAGPRGLDNRMEALPTIGVSVALSPADSDKGRPGPGPPRDCWPCHGDSRTKCFALGPRGLTTQAVLQVSDGASGWRQSRRAA